MLIVKRSIVAACLVSLAVAWAESQETVYTPGNGVSLPTVTKSVSADYTSEAMANRIEGKVGLSAVVLADGKVGEP